MLYCTAGAQGCVETHRLKDLEKLPSVSQRVFQFNSQANPVNNKIWPLYRGLKVKLRLAEENEVKEEKKKKCSQSRKH